MAGSGTIRLAYLVSQYPAVNHTYILTEVRALRKLGFEVQVVSIRASDRPPENLSEEELDEQRETYTVLKAGIVTIFAAHVLTMLRRPLAYLRGLFEVSRLSRGFREALANLIYFGESVVVGHRMCYLNVNHVHSHYTSTVALFIARVFPITFSATIHGPDEFNDVIGFHVAKKVARARFLCAISSYALSQLMKASEPRHFSKLEMNPLGIDCGKFLPREHRSNPSRFEVLCVGRLAPAKAQHLLIKAIDRLVREGRQSVHLRLVGDGPDWVLLQNLVSARGLEHHVTLEGACNHDRVLSFYQQTDLFVLASFAEGVPVVLMEAMAMEIPCVATWITGIPELIRHGEDGWLVPPADEAQLSAAIARLMDDAELRKKLGRSARLRVQEKYDLERNVERLAEIYRKRLG